MKHTTTPYIIQGHWGEDGFRIAHVESGLSQQIATTEGRGEKENRKNANFIVKSCNIIGHLESKGLIDLEKVTPEVMEEAIEAFRLLLDDVQTYAGTRVSVGKDYIKAIQQALSKLK